MPFIYLFSPNINVITLGTFTVTFLVILLTWSGWLAIAVILMVLDLVIYFYLLVVTIFY